MAESKLQRFIKKFPWVKSDAIPFVELKKPLKESKVAIVTTGGVYVNGDQPFAITDREDVDESYREISSDTANSQLRIAHEHFNKEYANKDINVIFPIDVMRSLVNEEFIGELSDINFSITGFIPEPKTIFETGNQIADRMKELGVDIVVIVPV